MSTNTPFLTAAQLRLASWAVLVCAIILALAGAVALFLRATGGLGFGPPPPPRISQQIVVERLQEVAKLVSIEMTLRDVVAYEQTRFRSTKRLLLVVTARVAAGIDLSKDTKVEIDSVAKLITISVPPAEVMSVDVLNYETYDERAGLWNPFRPEDRDAIQRQVRSKLILSAQQSGILQHADKNASKVLTDLLSQDGYTVEIRRPPVQLRPAN